MLDHFCLEQFVGGGGMGSVYRATDTVLARTVAVKVLSHERATDDDTTRRFENEAQSAARLDHENIARVFYVGEDDGLKFIVFEFIEGVNIRDLVHEQGPLPVEDAVSYVLQIAEAVSHANKRDVVHRDIKPSNVLITPDGRAKLVDMGLARFEQTPEEDDLTATGVTLGTFDYISPEQARDPRTADVRSDLYSLGCTLYFMLTGRPPFPEGTVLQKLLSHSSEEPTDPQILRLDLPDEIADIVRRLLAKNPDQRFQEPSALVGELLLAADHLGIHPATQGGTVWISSKSPRLSAFERHLPWVAPMLLLMLAVLAFDWFWPARHRTGLSEAGPDRPNPSWTVQTAEADSSRLGTDGQTLTGDSLSPADGSEPLVAADGPGRDPTESQSLSSQSGPGSHVDDSVDFVDAAESTSRDAHDRMPDAVAQETRGGNRTSLDDPPFPPTTGPYPDSGEPEYPYQPLEPNDASISEPPREIEAVPSPDVLVVGEYQPQSAEDRSQFCESLESACRRALTSPAVRLIELRYDGYRREPEEPFTLANPDLTIRAADGFRPVVRFRPVLSALEMSNSSMIRIVGGRLRIEGIQFEFDVPVESELNWQLFQLEQVQELELDHCYLTIRDPAVMSRNRMTSFPLAYRQTATVIDLQTPPGQDAMMDEDHESIDGWSVINLWNCVIRGEATTVRAAEAVPFRLRWVNGLLATSGRMLDVGGTGSNPDESQFHIRVDLDHVTAVVEQGLCRVQADDDTRPFVMTIDMNCSQCIFVTTPGVPLIEHLATVERDPAELDSRFLFSGQRNFYEDVDVCWRRKVRVRLLDGEQQQQDMDAEEWKERWRETLAKWNKVEWNGRPDASVALHEQTPASYGLDHRLGNLAVESGPGPNGGNAGFDSNQLPSVHRPASSSSHPARSADQSGSDSWRLNTSQRP